MSRRIWKRLFMKAVVWFAIVALTIAAFFGTLAAWTVFKKERLVKSGLDRTVGDLTDLQERKEALEKTLHNLDTERGIEEEIRKRFPLTKPGEEVIVLLDAKDSSVDTGTSSRQSIWRSFLDWFGR